MTPTHTTGCVGSRVHVCVSSRLHASGNVSVRACALVHLYPHVLHVYDELLNPATTARVSPFPQPARITQNPLHRCQLRTNCRLPNTRSPGAIEDEESGHDLTNDAGTHSKYIEPAEGIKDAGDESDSVYGSYSQSHTSLAGGSGPISAKNLVPRESVAYSTIRESLTAGRASGTAGLTALLCGSDRQIGMGAQRTEAVPGPEEVPSTLLDPTYSRIGSGRPNGGQARGCGTDRSHASVVV